MNAQTIPLSLHMTLIMGALAFAAPLAAMAAEATPASVVHVRVFPDYYAVNGLRLGDVVALEALIGPTDGRVVRLDKCAPGASQALLAAVEMLQVVHAGVLEIHNPPAGEPECTEAMAGLNSEDSVSGSAGASAYVGTDPKGRLFMP